MTDITEARDILKVALVHIQEALVLISPRENGKDADVNVTDMQKVAYLLETVDKEDTFYHFVEDMEETLKRYGTLTKRQSLSVSKSYERAKREKAREMNDEAYKRHTEGTPTPSEERVYELEYGNPYPSDDIPF